MLPPNEPTYSDRKEYSGACPYDGKALERCNGKNEREEDGRENVEPENGVADLRVQQNTLLRNRRRCQ